MHGGSSPNKMLQTELMAKTCVSIGESSYVWGYGIRGGSCVVNVSTSHSSLKLLNIQQATKLFSKLCRAQNEIKCYLNGVVRIHHKMSIYAAAKATHINSPCQHLVTRVTHTIHIRTNGYHSITQERLDSRTNAPKGYMPWITPSWKKHSELEAVNANL